MHLIDEYGFIPNGSRVYYLNRSQPPYFSSMVLKGFLACDLKNIFYKAFFSFLKVMAFYDYCAKSTELTCEKKQEYRQFVLGSLSVFIF